jgi:P-type E1-E2 ATPase
VTADNGMGAAKVLACAAALGGQSRHAASRGISDYAAQRGAVAAALSSIRTVAGRGLVALGEAGAVSLGSVRLMEERGLAFDAALGVERNRILEAGQAIACIGWDERVRGIFGLSEEIRSHACESIDALKRTGLHVEVLTGDHRRAGSALSVRLNVVTKSELLPEDKIAHLRRLRAEKGPVAMVGDGLNDAPSLVAADVGVAMGCGADLTRESAAVCLLGNDLRAIPWLALYARRTVRAIRANLFWAFFYNVIGVTLAATGRLSPVLAASAMVISSALVTANSLRLAASAREGWPCTN